MTSGSEKIALLRAIKEASSERAEVPRLSLGYAVAMLAFGLLIVREYDDAWPLIGILAALSVVCLLVAAASLALRVISLKNIETLGAREMFDGRLPDPESMDYQRQLGMYRGHYRLSGKIGVPAFLCGTTLLAITTLVIVSHHLLKQ